jgi:hypothetical protein
LFNEVTNGKSVELGIATCKSLIRAVKEYHMRFLLKHKSK